MKRRDLLAAAAGLAAVRPALAQTGFPNHAVEVVVPFAAGGPTDRYVRTVTQALRQAWNQPVVINNRPGAGGAIGTQAVARAAPDGHTLLVASFGLVSNQLLMRDLPYNPAALAPISLIALGGLTLYVSGSLGARDVPSLLTVAKARPGGLRFGSSGVGSTPHIAAELFAARAGVEMIHVPYRGAALAMTDLLTGQIDAVFTTTAPPSGGNIASPPVPIATSGTQRTLLNPQIPTLKEAGLDVVARTWYGFLVPSATPAAIQAQLAASCTALRGQADIRKIFTDDDLEPRFSTAEEFSQFIADELRYWGPVLRERNIEL